MTRPKLALVLIGSFLAAACSGSVFKTADDKDAGGGSDSDTTGGSGGSLTGGSGGSVTGGSGGSVTGGSGGYVTGGSGGGDPVCPPAPLCENWCNGEPVFDDRDCLVGYMCDDGVDPCVTRPCAGPADCEPNEICENSLCRPGGSPTCSERVCQPSPDPDASATCQCWWDCNDGRHYETSCTTQQGGAISCQCSINGESQGGCGESGGAGGGPDIDPCSFDCCGFPQ